MLAVSSWNLVWIIRRLVANQIFISYHH